MTVGELIKKLQELPQDLEVTAWSSDYLEWVSPKIDYEEGDSCICIDGD